MLWYGIGTRVVGSITIELIAARPSSPLRMRPPVDEGFPVCETSSKSQPGRESDQPGTEGWAVERPERGIRDNLTTASTLRTKLISGIDGRLCNSLACRTRAEMNCWNCSGLAIIVDRSMESERASFIHAGSFSDSSPQQLGRRVAASIRGESAMTTWLWSRSPAPLCAVTMLRFLTCMSSMSGLRASGIRASACRVSQKHSRTPPFAVSPLPWSGTDQRVSAPCPFTSTWNRLSCDRRSEKPGTDESPSRRRHRHCRCEPGLRSVLIHKRR
jgi:hypothetical protein